MWEIAFQNAACSDKTASKYTVPKDSEAFAVLLIARGKQPYGKTVASSMSAQWEIYSLLGTFYKWRRKKTEAAKSIDYSLEIQ